MLKYKYISLLLVIATALSGCNLDTDDDNKMPGDKFWAGTQANADAFLLSIYQNLRKATTSNGYFFYTGDLRCAPVVGVTNDYKYLLSNDLKTYKSKMDKNEGGTSENCGAIYNWKQMYQVIQSANIMIEEVSRIGGITSEEVEHYRAECRFLRSLSYFFLVRIFGDVPYYTEAYYAKVLPRTNKATVLRNCLEDLQSLLDSDPNCVILPWRNGKGSQHANRGAVLTLMMHMNMWLAFFEENENNTLNYYNEVVRLAELDSWVTGTMYALQDMEQISEVFKGDSNEGLFEIAQNVSTGEIFNTSNMWCTNVVYSVLSKTAPTYTYSKVFLTKLYPEEDTDLRKSYWFKNLYPSLEPDETTAPKVEIIKMLNSDSYKSTIVPNAGNYIVFRLADAILLYAEALNKIGRNDEARTQVNRIRERAGATLFEADGNLDADIYWERVRELMGEGHYFFDLVRTKKIVDVDFATFNGGTDIDGTTIAESGFRETMSNIKQGAWTWPIYRGALDNNSYISKNMYWE